MCTFCSENLNFHIVPLIRFEYGYFANCLRCHSLLYAKRQLDPSAVGKSEWDEASTWWPVDIDDGQHFRRIDFSWQLTTLEFAKSLCLRAPRSAFLRKQNNNFFNRLGEFSPFLILS